MEILAAYDLTGSYRDAAELVGCSHHTVARYVRARDAGELRTTPAECSQRIDPFREKIEEWIDASRGRVRADVAQRKLEAMGYSGSERTTRRAVAEAKAIYTLATGGGFGHGCRSRGCGFSGTTPMAPWLTSARRGCGAPGWPGAAFGWCCQSAIRRCRQ